MTARATDRVRRAAESRWSVLTRQRQFAVDLLAMVIGALDVWLVIPPKAQPYSIVLSAVACLALAVRRRFPFTVVLIAVPGFLAGWAELTAMIALATLARRRLLGWQTIVGAVLVWICRFTRWPLDDFAGQTWREHALDGIYACFVVGMPIGLALLASARQELFNRISELADSRERERRFHAHAIRAEERARLAREMHDLVSHQVSLIAMQAGALRMAAEDPESRKVAGTIRELSSRTLDELRQLVGVLRTEDADDPQPGLAELPELVQTAGVTASLTIQVAPLDLANAISAAVYRTVQEALTNIRKHAQGSIATVRVYSENNTVLVEVRNDRPRRQPTALSATLLSLGTLPSGGHGLVGLRERAALLGGTLHAGPTTDGGYLVRAVFPALYPPSDEPA
ncbi:sensor histidine kinase [Solihabitans fulvus]|nr:histidine kinase [Solihabitans fulvus]